jgi:flagellin
MLTGAPLSVAGSRIALFSRSNSNNLGASLVRLASGKRVNRPSDGIPEYFFSEKLSRESRSYQPVLRDIGEGLAFLDVATAAGESVFNAVRDMRELVRMYYRPEATAADRTAYQAEFGALKSAVTSLAASTTYNGAKIIGDNGGNPFKTIALDSKTGAETIEIAYDSSDIADVSLLELGIADEATEFAAVETELGKAGSYLAKTSAATYGLNAHYNLTTTKMKTTGLGARQTVEADTGEEIARAMNLSIRNQSSLAMMAQANMYSGSVVRLLGW